MEQMKADWEVAFHHRAIGAMTLDVVGLTAMK